MQRRIHICQRCRVSFSYSHEWSVAASPTEVFRALVEPSALRRWFAEDVQVEPRLGGVYRYWGRHTLGTPPQDAARQVITHFEPDVTLAFDWPIDEVETDVTITLTRTPRGTTLSLTHAVARDSGVMRGSIESFWQAAIGNLIAYLGGRETSLPDYFDRGRG